MFVFPSQQELLFFIQMRIPIMFQFFVMSVSFVQYAM